MMIRSSKPLQRIKRQSVPNEIAGQLRDHILEEGLLPGHRLPGEQELCDLFGASRVSIREALKLLEGGGLIRVKPGAAGGIQVAQPAPQQWSEAFAAFCHLQNVSVEQLLEFRLGLEGVTVSLAAQRARPGEIANLKAVVAEMQAPGVSLERFHALDIRFHTLIAESSGNEVFALFMHAARYAMQRAITRAYGKIPDPSGVNRQIASEHLEIVRQLEAGEAGAAEAAMKDHLRGFYAALFELEESDA